MRTLSGTLLAEMQSLSIDFLVKIQLTHGASSYTYDQTRILGISPEEEQPYSHTAKVVLNNSDGALTNLDLKGYKAVISWGAVTTSGNEYSATPPLWVIGQQLNSSEGVLDCTLELWGIPNFLAEDRASEDYLPDEDDTRTVKYLLNAIIASWSTLPPFDWLPSYGVIFDSEDDLINTYMPKDSFRIYVNDSRLAKIRELLDYTKCVMRFGGDGKVHIFNPTTSGTSYDYQYSLESGHTFFAKAYRKRLVIPNTIYVKSQPGDIPQHVGWAFDSDSVNAFREVREWKRVRLQSDIQAQGIAQATLSKYQLNAEMGAAEVPINFGAELFDYIKVTDERESDYRVGNIGSLTRNYKAYGKQYSMRFSLGGWLTLRKLLNDLQVMGGFDFNRLTVKDLYAENLLADNIDLIWLDPEGNIDLSLIGDDLDGLPDGELYARVKSLHLDAGQIKLDEHIFYQAGYDPSEKRRTFTSTPTTPYDVGDLWLDGNVVKRCITAKASGSYISAHWVKVSLDEIGDGSTYKRIKSAALTAGGLVILDNVVIGTYGLVRSTDISAGHIILSSCQGTLDNIDEGSTYGRLKQTDIDSGHIKLTSYTKVAGEWYNESGVEIDATHGINIYGANQAFTTRATKFGTIQCYVGSDGHIYAGAGAVSLDAGGITVKGNLLKLKSSDGVKTNYFYTRPTSGNLYVVLQGDFEIQGVTRPAIGNSYDLGKLGYEWKNAYATIFRPKSSTSGGIILGTSAKAEAGSLKWDGGGGIYVHDGSNWRHIT